MRFEFTEAETDYLHRLLLTRPMGEVEPLVAKIRQQVASQAAPAPKDEAPAGLPEGAQVRPNGAGIGVDSLPLP